jgi:hypothetical protein
MKKSISVLTLLIITSLLLLPLGWKTASADMPDVQSESGIHYVMPNAEGDCSSWEAACDLQFALSLAEAGDQIWVAAGTYKPTTDTDRLATFQLESGVAIYGGFAGAETSLTERDWETNITTLNGDIGTLDDSADNSYHVVTGSGVDETAILDGFTITAGNANAEPSPHTFGGGMYTFVGNPTLNNLIFNANHAQYGAGMYNAIANPTVTNVIFSANIVPENGAGGGINNYYSDPTITNATFSENTALWGGGIYNFNSSPELTNVTFSVNTAYFYNYGRGAGIYNDHSNPILLNATFSGNNARYGGGIFNTEYSNSVLTNVTFTGNTADLSYSNGGGISNMNHSNVTIVNSIFWGNLPDQVSKDHLSTATVTYSVIQGDSIYPGEGNINADPMLQPLADNGGFTLTHALGAGSPAIDAGNPDPATCPYKDQRGFPRPVDGDGDGVATCDIGAFEYEPLNQIFLPLIMRN